MKKHSRLFGNIAIGALAFLYLSLAIWLYWSLYPYKTINYLNDPFQVDPAEPASVKQGGTIIYNIHYCKYTDDMPISIEKEFVDGIVFQTAEQKALITGQGCGEVDVPVKIPVTLPPGEYRLRVTVKYRVNPIRIITKVSETQEFIVTRNATGAYGDSSNNGVQPVEN